MKRLRGVALWFAIWTIVALFFSTRAYADSWYSGHPLTWMQSATLSLVEWYLWAILSPFIFWLARRMRWQRGRLLGAAVVSIPIALLVAALQLNVYAIIIKSFSWLPPRAIGAGAAYFNIATFAALLGVGIALDYARRLREREVSASRLEAQLAQARLDVLSSRLQPHFLFNTLHTIAELVHENAEHADQMITDLSELLRLSLASEGAATVPLRTEFDLLERYLAIQRVRFQDRLTATIDAKVGTLDFPVPQFILQPLVENAIRHGVAAKAGKGIVTVTARVDDGRLFIDVTDDGPGMPGGTAPKEGVGLANTRARLNELYGTRHEFALTNGPDGGVRARLILPLDIEPVPS